MKNWLKVAVLSGVGFIIMAPSATFAQCSATPVRGTVRRVTRAVPVIVEAARPVRRVVRFVRNRPQRVQNRLDRRAARGPLLRRRR